MDLTVEQLQNHLDEHYPEQGYDAFEEFKRNRRRAHSEPRCKDYHVVGLENAHNFLPEKARANQEKIDRLWRKDYRAYLERQIDRARWKSRNPVATAAAETIFDLKKIRGSSETTPPKTKGWNGL